MNILTTVSMPRPQSHLFEVELQLDGVTDAHVDLTMPVWTPGSYMIKDYARHVVRFNADGLPSRKINKNTWRIITRGRARVRVRYTVYANEFSVRSAHLDDTHGHFTGPDMFMYIPGHANLPVTLRIRPPRGWRIATALPRASGANTYIAANYDTLVDSPMEIGACRSASFHLRGKNHTVVVHGDGNYDFPKMVRDIRTVVNTQTKFFGEAPYPHYTFFLHTLPQGGGGLEHMNSTSLLTRSYTFAPPERYENFMRLVSHEFFHLWNVKRIRPADLIPFDYQKENYTPLLWVCEGVTNYYDDLLVARAGLIAPKRYLERVAERIQLYRQKPGRRVQTLAESSFDTWIKHYQPDENSINATISYYEKGSLVGMLLDMAIRGASRGRRSLDDVMRALNSRFARRHLGYSPADFEQLCDEFAGRTLKEFFKKYVYGLEELDFNAAMRTVGLTFEEKPKEKTGKSYLGLQTSRSGDRLMINHVLAEGPAYEHGLAARDELLAIDGIKIDPDEWDKQLASKKPGQKCVFTIFRMGRLRSIPVRLGVKRETTPKLVPVKKLTSQQKAAFRNWTGHPLQGF